MHWRSATKHFVCPSTFDPGQLLKLDHRVAGFQLGSMKKDVKKPLLYFLQVHTLKKSTWSRKLFRTTWKAAIIIINSYLQFWFAVCATCLSQNINFIKPNLKRTFLHDVMMTRLVFQNNETAAMLVSQTNPVGVEPAGLFRGWRVAGDRWRVTGSGWRVRGSRWRVTGGGWWVKNIYENKIL